MAILPSVIRASRRLLHAPLLRDTSPRSDDEPSRQLLCHHPRSPPPPLLLRLHRRTPLLLRHQRTPPRGQGKVRWTMARPWCQRSVTKRRQWKRGYSPYSGRPLPPTGPPPSTATVRPETRTVSQSTAQGSFPLSVVPMVHASPTSTSTFLPRSFLLGRLASNGFSSQSAQTALLWAFRPVLRYSNPKEIALSPENYAKAYPLIYEVVAGGLIRAEDISDPCTAKYMQTESGTSLADQLASLIVINLKEGINIGPLLREDNVRIYPSNCCLQIISAEMTDKTGKVTKADAYAPGAALYTQLLDYSVGGGLLKSDLPAHINDFIECMENADTCDLRIITNHSATFTPQVRMGFRLQAELLISDLLPTICLLKQTNVLEAVPYTDVTCVTCIQDKHPAFASWLAPAKKFTLATWTLKECGRTVVKVHRHGTVHSFGPFLKGAVSTITDPASTDFLLNYKMPLYPSAVIQLCVQESIFDDLDMCRIRPEKAGYCNFNC